MSPEPLARDFAPRADRLRETAETLSQRLPALMVEADRVAATVVQGAHGRRRTGHGDAFWQFRLYQVGDAAGDIDWRQSARSRHLFVREQEWEAAESVWIWCDLSRSMAWRSERALPLKWERAVLMTLALASMLTRGGERVALLGSGMRPASGRFGLEQLGRALVLTAARPSELPPPARLPRLARLVLVSDFLQPLPVIERHFAEWDGLGARASLMQIRDAAEEVLPYEGRVQFEGLEADGSALIDNVGGIRERYRNVIEAHRHGLTAAATRRGWRFAAHRTDKPPEMALLALVAMLAPRAVS